MDFKLSGRELMVLEDRDKILNQLSRGNSIRSNRSSIYSYTSYSYRNSSFRRSTRRSCKISIKRRPVRPPVLVVPRDESGLIQIIERDTSYSDNEEGDGDGEKDHTGGPEEKQGSKLSRSKWWREILAAEDKFPPPRSPWEKFLFILRRLRLIFNLILRRLRRQRRQRRRQKRAQSYHQGLEEGLNAVLTAGMGPAFFMNLNSQQVQRRQASIRTNSDTIANAWMFLNHPMVKCNEKCLSVKCRVKVLSDYSKLFAVLDAVLETNLGLGFEEQEQEQFGDIQRQRPARTRTQTEVHYREQE